MHSPARSAVRRLPRQKQKSAGPLVGLLVVVTALVVVITFAANQRSTIGVNKVPVVVVHPVPSKPVHLVFEPPVVHNDLQTANQQMVGDIIRDPSSWGLKDKAPIDLSGNILQVYLATLETENHFYHYNSNGDVQLSYSGCCVGVGQVFAETSVCQGWELADIRRNVWCSARIFANYYDEYRVKAPARSFELTVARYKGAVLLDKNGNMVLDSKGLPIIPGDPNDPKSPVSQVNRVFIDPDTGKPMFRFVPD